MKGLLFVIARAERVLTVAAFALMAVALLADVISRRLFQTGLIGATEVAVVGMIAVAMFGIGIATDEGAHLRPRLFDKLFPKSAEGAIDRAASFVAGAFFAVFAGLAVWMVIESAGLGDRTEIMNFPVWMLQSMIAIAFATNAMRNFVFAADPSLKPSDDPEQAAAGAVEEEAR